MQQEKYSFQSEKVLMFLKFIPLETSSYIWFTKSWTCTTLAIHVIKCTLWVKNFTMKSQCINMISILKNKSFHDLNTWWINPNYMMTIIMIILGLYTIIEVDDLYLLPNVNFEWCDPKVFEITKVSI